MRPDLFYASILQQQGANSLAPLMINVVLIVAIFYFLLIRPSRKERARQQEMIAGLQKGDEVITNGGVIGTIVRVGKDRLTIQTGEDTRLVVARQRVAKFSPEPASPD